MKDTIQVLKDLRGTLTDHKAMMEIWFPVESAAYVEGYQDGLSYALHALDTYLQAHTREEK